MPKPLIYLLFALATGIAAFLAFRTGRFFMAAALLGASFCFVAAAVTSPRRR